MVLVLLVGLLLPVARAGVPTRMPPSRERGENLYAAHCVACHGERAAGDGPQAARLGAPPLARRWPESERAEAARVIRFGRGAMPGFSAVFDRHDTERILTWLDSLADAPPAKDGASEGDAPDGTPGAGGAAGGAKPGEDGAAGPRPPPVDGKPRPDGAEGPAAR